MKKHVVVLLMFGFLFKACYNEPFDYTLLDANYWNCFAESVKLVAFDRLGVAGSYGYYNDSDANRFVYTSDIYDSTYSERLFFIHFLKNDKITHSLVDSFEFAYDDICPKIEWDVSSSGIIQGANKYNLQGKLTSIEEYVIEQLPDSLQTPYKSLMIKEKKKLNVRGVLQEHLIYDLEGNYTLQAIE